MSFETFKTYLYKKYLNWLCRNGKIKSHIETITDGNQPCIGKKGDQREEVSVAALQVKMKLYSNPLEFIDKINTLVLKAVKQGAELIVFPENNLFQLLGLLPGLAIQGNIHNENGIEELLTELGNGTTITDILGFVGPIIRRVALTTFSELSCIYKVYIMTGTGMFPDKKNNIYNSGFLFGPEGNIVGQQKKAHLLPIEDRWGIKTGDNLEVFDTRLGKLAFPICMDATYFESFRILANKGVEIVMVPIANPEAEYNYWTALRGIWGRVQESRVYGIKSAMVGEFLGFTFTGQAGIYAPLEMTVKKNGVIAEASSYDQEEVITANLNLKQLQQYRNSHEYVENKELWQNYFPQIYYSIRF